MGVLLYHDQVECHGCIIMTQASVMGVLSWPRRVICYHDQGECDVCVIMTKASVMGVLSAIIMTKASVMGVLSWPMPVSWMYYHDQSEQSALSIWRDLLSTVLSWLYIIIQCIIIQNYVQFDFLRWLLIFFIFRVLSTTTKFISSSKSCPSFSGPYSVVKVSSYYSWSLDEEWISTYNIHTLLLTGVYGDTWSPNIFSESRLTIILFDCCIWSVYLEPIVFNEKVQRTFLVKSTYRTSRWCLPVAPVNKSTRIIFYFLLYFIRFIIILIQPVLYSVGSEKSLQGRVHFCSLWSDK